MRCEQAEPLLGAWRDAELDVLTRMRIGWHVRHCTGCASEAARLDRLMARLAPLDPVIGYDAPRGVGASAAATHLPCRCCRLFVVPDCRAAVASGGTGRDVTCCHRHAANARAETGRG